MDQEEPQKYALTQAADRLRVWMRQEALPFWCAHGVEPHTGSGFDRLSAAGEPGPSDDRHMGMHAWQIYLFAQAEQLGWFEGSRDRVKRLVAFVSRHGTRPCRSDGYVHAINSCLEITDARYDLHDHALFMLSSTASYAAYGDGAELRRAHNILDWLNLKYAHPAGGWCEGSAGASARRSVSHMRLFDAFLSLYEVTRAPIWYDQAASIHVLFVKHFYASSQGVVHEHFDEYWKPAESRPPAIRPLHLFNWASLLRRFEHCGGGDQSAVADALYDTALSTLMSPSGGFVQADSVGADGVQDIATLVECIKASASQAKAGREAASGIAVEAVKFLFEQYLDSAPAGTYLNRSLSPVIGSEAFVTVDVYGRLLMAASEMVSLAEGEGR